MRFVGLGIGAKIQVIKANQIIPYVSAVDQPSMIGVERLPICPDCGIRSELNASQVDAICLNEDCPGKVLVTLQKQIELFDIDFISEATIEKLVDAGYDTLEKIFRLTVEELVVLDGFGLTSARYLVNALQHASLTEAKVFKAAGLKQLGARKGAMLLDHYGSLDNMILSIMERGLDDIPNFGDIQKGLIEDNLGAIVEIQKRFRALNITILPHKKETIAMQVCMTGTCPGIPRADLEVKLMMRKIKVLDSVTKDCSLLICEDPNGSSSKLQKARKLGIPIQSYKDFLATLS
jgi:DNA ligase (NAD+)